VVAVVVAVAVQSVFYLEMHQNDFFFIFKTLFLKSAHQNNLKILKKINKKNLKFKRIRFQSRSQTCHPSSR
jgi:hypothetical protein